MIMTKLFHVSLWVLMGWTLCSVWNPLTAAASNPININVIITESHLLSGHGRPAVDGSSIDYVAIVGAKISLDKIHSGPNGTTSWFRVKPGEDTTIVAIDDAANTTQANSTGRFTCSKKGKVTLQAMVTFAGVYKNPPPEFTIRVIDFSIKAAESGDLQNIVDGLTAVPAIPPLYLPAKKNPQGAYQQIKAYAPGITTDAEKSVHWQIKESKADPVFDDWAGQANGIPVKLTPEPITAADPGNHTFILQAGIDDDQNGELSDGEVYRALKIKVVEVQFKLDLFNNGFTDPPDPFPVLQGIGGYLAAYISPPDPDVLAKISFYVDDPSKIKSITPVVPGRNPELLILEASASHLGQTTLHAHAAISTGYNLDDNGIELIDPMQLSIDKSQILAGGLPTAPHQTAFDLDFDPYVVYSYDYPYPTYTATITITGGAGADNSRVWWWGYPSVPANFSFDLGDYDLTNGNVQITFPIEQLRYSGIITSSNKEENISIDVRIDGTQASEPTNVVSFVSPTMSMVLPQLMIYSALGNIDIIGTSTVGVPAEHHVRTAIKKVYLKDGTSIGVDTSEQSNNSGLSQIFDKMSPFSFLLPTGMIVQLGGSNTAALSEIGNYVRLSSQPSIDLGGLSSTEQAYADGVFDAAGNLRCYLKIVNPDVVKVEFISADLSVEQK